MGISGCFAGSYASEATAGYPVSKEPELTTLIEKITGGAATVFGVAVVCSKQGGRCELNLVSGDSILGGPGFDSRIFPDDSRETRKSM